MIDMFLYVFFAAKLVLGNSLVQDSVGGVRRGESFQSCI